MTKTTRTIIGARARKAVIDGVNSIYQPVRLTLGPQAKKALLYRTYNRGSRIVDDGYMVAEVQEPKDPFVRLAAQTFKEACKRTNEKVGDATTTTAVIGGKLMNDAYRMLTDGASEFTAKRSGKVGVMTLRSRILETAAKVRKMIADAAVKVSSLEDMERIATVSVDDPELGKVIAKMAWETGLDGFIDVVEGYKGEVETESAQGFKFHAKIPAKAFVNNPARYEMVAEDCPVLVTNHALDNGGDFAQLFQELNKSTSKIVIVAPSFSENVLVNMVNAIKQGFFIFPVHVPSLRTEQFEDLAVYMGANFVDKQKGRKLRNANERDLGFVAKLIVKDTESRDEAVATGGRGSLEEKVFDGDAVKGVSKVSERIATLKAQILETKEENFKKLLERRISSLASAGGVIRVGDSTQASSLYRKLKVEDAVNACKAALRGGYVRGGGVCLRDIADGLPDGDIMKAALKAPYDQIQSSVDGGLEIGPEIIDPAEAMSYAVEHAASVAANLITVEILTPEADEPIPGEGEMAIARAIMQTVYAQKRRDGIMQANEEEMEGDLLGGLTHDEIIDLDNG